MRETLKHPAVLSAAIISLALLTHKAMDMAAENPYRYEKMRIQSPSGGDWGEAVFRIDVRTGEAERVVGSRDRSYRLVQQKH